MNNTTSILKILTGLGLLALTSCTSVSSKGFKSSSYQASWPQRCQAIKKDLSQQPAVKITYDPLPQDVAITSSWKLNWFGRQIPVPAIQYTDVFVMHNEDQHSLVFKGQIEGQTTLVMLGRSVNSEFEPIVDIFAEIADSGKAENSSEGTALTKELFGGPVTLERLTDLGYRHTLADLTCDQANWQEEVPIAVALISKGIAASIGPNTSAYDLNQGVLLHSKSESQDKWWFQWKSEKQYMDALFHLPKGHQHSDLGFALGQKDWPIAPNVPVWLAQLETAIANPTRTNWLSLKSEFQKAKFSEESIQKIDHFIEAIPKE